MIRNLARVLIQSRTSPISGVGMILTLGLAAIALIATISTGLRFTALPSLMPVIAGVLILDILSKLAAQTRLVWAIQVLLYGVLYLAITCFCGVLAAYSAQRIAFPLQDHLFADADQALGMNWPGDALSIPLIVLTFLGASWLAVRILRALLPQRARVEARNV